MAPKAQEVGWIAKGRQNIASARYGGYGVVRLRGAFGGRFAFHSMK